MGVKVPDFISRMLILEQYGRTTPTATMFIGCGRVMQVERTKPVIFTSVTARAKARTRLGGKDRGGGGGGGES